MVLSREGEENMKEQADETPYARLKRLRAAIEEKAVSRMNDETIDDSVRAKTERLRQLRSAKEAMDRAARKYRSE